jgi:hypothetical protein
MLEKLIYARLYAHIDMNSILVQKQYGFMTHFSTEQATFSLINSILTAMNIFISLISFLGTPLPL